MCTDKIVRLTIIFICMVNYEIINITNVYCSSSDLSETDTEVNTTKGHDDDDESNSSPSSLNDAIDSCKNKCGRWNLLPCSCDPKCLVYSNCCEDFMTECPDTARESGAKYAGLIRAKTKCVFDIFVLESCPESGQFLNANDVIKNDLQQRSLNDTNASYVPNNNTGNYLSKIKNSIPISDLSTGFTFANRSVYDCNKFSTSVPVFWEVASDKLEINLKRNFLSVANVAEKLQSFTVQPPEYIEASIKTSICAQMAFGECRRRISGIKGDTDMCGSFISYVSDANEIFRNRHCAACNGTTSAVPLSQETWDLFSKHQDDFAIMMSLGARGLTFTCRRDDHSRVSLRVKWSKMECIAGEERNGTERLPCEITCSEPAEKRPDGICKELTHLRIVLSSAAASSLGVRELDELSTSMHCYLSKVVRMDVSENWDHSAVKGEDGQEGKSYQIDFSLYEEDPLITRNLIIKYQETLMAMGHSLYVHREKIFSFSGANLSLALNRTKLLAYINPLCFRLLPDVASKQPELSDTQLTCFDITMNNTIDQVWMDEYQVPPCLSRERSTGKSVYFDLFHVYRHSFFIAVYLQSVLQILKRVFMSTFDLL